jgi:hypothetical protein
VRNDDDDDDNDDDDDDDDDDEDDNDDTKHVWPTWAVCVLTGVQDVETYITNIYHKHISQTYITNIRLSLRSLGGFPYSYICSHVPIIDKCNKLHPLYSFLCNW